MDEPESKPAAEGQRRPEHHPEAKGALLFRKFANRTSTAVGTPAAFLLACTTILIWALTGPLFHYSDTWQLVINTGTTIITFLMVFLIQNTQNRDALAIHLKLDELIRALSGARNQLVDLENLTDADLARLKLEFSRLRQGTADEGAATTDAGAADIGGISSVVQIDTKS